jgi:hypothetical protein
LFPEEFVVAFEEMSIFFEDACVGVENCIELKKRIGGGVVSAFDFLGDEVLEPGG